MEATVFDIFSGFPMTCYNTKNRLIKHLLYLKKYHPVHILTGPWPPGKVMSLPRNQVDEWSQPQIAHLDSTTSGPPVPRRSWLWWVATGGPPLPPLATSGHQWPAHHSQLQPCHPYPPMAHRRCAIWDNDWNIRCWGIYVWIWYPRTIKSRCRNQQQ